MVLEWEGGGAGFHMKDNNTPAPLPWDSIWNCHLWQRGEGGKGEGGIKGKMGLENFAICISLSLPFLFLPFFSLRLFISFFSVVLIDHFLRLFSPLPSLYVFPFSLLSVITMSPPLSFFLSLTSIYLYLSSFIQPFFFRSISWPVLLC